VLCLWELFQSNYLLSLDVPSEPHKSTASSNKNLKKYKNLTFQEDLAFQSLEGLCHHMFTFLNQVNSSFSFFYIIFVFKEIFILTVESFTREDSVVDGYYYSYDWQFAQSHYCSSSNYWKMFSLKLRISLEPTLWRHLHIKVNDKITVHCWSCFSVFAAVFITSSEYYWFAPSKLCLFHILISLEPKDHLLLCLDEWDYHFVYLRHLELRTSEH
jgi:hypothetical protein